MKTIKGVIVPAIAWITGTIAPLFESTLGWWVQNISPLFSAWQKEEIIFWLQSTAFIVTIITGLRALLKQKRREK